MSDRYDEFTHVNRDKIFVEEEPENQKVAPLKLGLEALVEASELHKLKYFEIIRNERRHKIIKIKSLPKKKIPHIIEEDDFFCKPK